MFYNICLLKTYLVFFSSKFISFLWLFSDLGKDSLQTTFKLRKQTCILFLYYILKIVSYKTISLKYTVYTGIFFVVYVCLKHQHKKEIERPFM